MSQSLHWDKNALLSFKMLKSLFKKKISEDKLSNALLNSLIETMENGFGNVAELINNSPDFERSPSIATDDYDQFLFILFVGNLDLMHKSLELEQADAIEEQLIGKFSITFDLSIEQTKQYIKEYKDFMRRVNYPSKNVLYGMSKSVFYKYNLSQFQEDYFRDMNVPNPVFLKKLNELVSNFIWDWDYFMDKYKVD